MDSRERDHSLTIARSCDLDLPVTFRMSVERYGLGDGLMGFAATPSKGNARSEAALSCSRTRGLASQASSRSRWSSSAMSRRSADLARLRSTLSDLYVVCQLWSDNKPLTIPFRTAHKSFKDRYVWNETFTLPIRYKDLPLGAQLIFTVWDYGGPPAINAAVPVGGTTLRLFGKKCTLKKGKQRMHLWPDKEADAHVNTSTPSKIPGEEKDERGRLEKIMEKQKRKDIPTLDWLDKLAFRQIERIHAEESAKSDKLFLYVDLPRFDLPIVFGEMEFIMPSLPPLVGSTSTAPAPTPTVNGLQSPAVVLSNVDTGLMSIVDPEIARNNPVEEKYLRLVRSHRSGPLDREMKPNAAMRDELNSILDYPPTQALTSTESNLLWQFRFYLTRDKRALTKFLKSVRWGDRDEVKQAVEVLLPMWSEIEIGDALELLGPGEAFRDKRVRAFAVKQLARANDEELTLYLLQLVQALKFEPPQPGSSTSATSRGPKGKEAQKGTSSANLPTLEDFLIERAVGNAVLGNNFHWYLMVEIEDKSVGKMYGRVAYKFMMRIAEAEGGEERRATIRRQAEFVTAISKLAKDIRGSKDARPKKIEKLKSCIHDPKLKLGSLPAPIPLPLDASMSITGIDADHSSVFKSNLFPLKLDLVCSDGSHFPVIFKNGDDLRQDQLVIQLFTLMDRLLRKENLDLKITPYRVLATGAVDGMVQFVPSKTLGAISSEYQGSLLNYLREEHPDETSTATYGVSAAVLDTFVRSCAGYCVVTYLLGVGDRHLDNLLLSPDGHFFHVDFGYILGRDPKPFPPAVKVCKEMVDAMGGMQSPHYIRFKNLCYTAFIGLRKNANLIINLISLMVDANIPDIKLEPDKAVSKVQEKFMLDLPEEEAIKHFEGLLNDTSYWTTMMDRVHAVAQYWRQ